VRRLGLPDGGRLPALVRGTVLQNWNRSFGPAARHLQNPIKRAKFPPFRAGKRVPILELFL
jgi:hypothetical protein